MKIYEFEQPDAQRDGLRLLRESRTSDIINENASQQVNNFIQAIEGYNIAQGSLQAGNFYCPITFVHDTARNNVMLIIVTDLAEYIKEDSSRLIFKYKNSSTLLPFPADGHTTPNDTRIITASMSDLNTIIQQFSLQFNKENWTTAVHGYDQQGHLKRITNL